MTNDDEMDRLEQELRDYLRTPWDAWKRAPKMRQLLERQKQSEEQLKKRTSDQDPRAETE